VCVRARACVCVCVCVCMCDRERERARGRCAVSASAQQRGLAARSSAPRPPPASRPPPRSHRESHTQRPAAPAGDRAALPGVEDALTQTITTSIMDNARNPAQDSPGAGARSPGLHMLYVQRGRHHLAQKQAGRNRQALHGGTLHKNHLRGLRLRRRVRGATPLHAHATTVNGAEALLRQPQSPHRPSRTPSRTGPCPPRTGPRPPRTGPRPPRTGPRPPRARFSSQALVHMALVHMSAYR